MKENQTPVPVKITPEQVSQVLGGSKLTYEIKNNTQKTTVIISLDKYGDYKEK